MSGVDLVLANCTSSDKTRTNLVYLHPDTLRLFHSDKVLISWGDRNIVHRVGGDAGLQPTQIGLSALGRAGLGLTENNIEQKTKLRVNSYKPSTATLCQMNIEVGVFGKTQVQ